MVLASESKEAKKALRKLMRTYSRRYSAQLLTEEKLFMRLIFNSASGLRLIAVLLHRVQAVMMLANESKEAKKASRKPMRTPRKEAQLRKKTRMRRKCIWHK